MPFNNLKLLEEPSAIIKEVILNHYCPPPISLLPYGSYLLQWLTSECVCVFCPKDGPVEILPFLYLGSAHHSSRREALASRGITAVLNVSSSCPNLFEAELTYKTLRVEDSLAADIRVLFPEAIQFIGECRRHSPHQSHILCCMYPSTNTHS